MLIPSFSMAAMASDFSEHWAKSYITEALNRKWVQGYPDGTFRPNNSITRAEFSSMLYHSLNLQEYTGENPFEDVKAGAWFYTGVMSVYGAGIASGYNEKEYAPNDGMTREMAFTMLAKAFGLSPNNKTAYLKFEDHGKLSDWASNPTSALIEQGYVSGKGDGVLAPKDLLSRAELATLLIIIYDEEKGKTPQDGPTTYYVSSTTGNDQNNGTSEAFPWKSLEKVSKNRYGKGDSIRFKCGDTWNGTVRFYGSGTKDLPIKVDSYGKGSAPILNGEGAKTDRELFYKGYSEISGTLEIIEGSYWNVSGLEITNYMKGSARFRVGILVADDCKTGIEYMATPQYGITIKDCYVHDVVSDDEEKRTGGIVIMGNANDVLIDNNVVEDVTVSGIRNVSWASFIDGHSDYRLKNYKVSNNVLKNIGGDCIVLGSVENGVMEYNYVNEYCTGDSEKDYAALWTWACRDIVIQYNEVTGGRETNSDGTPFDVDYYNENIVIQYNYTHDNYKGIAMFTENSTGTVFRYNISINDGKQRESTLFPYETASKESAPLIYNNLIYQSSDSTSKKLFNNSVGSNQLHVKLYNNVVISSDTMQFTMQNRITGGSIDRNIFVPSTIYTNSSKDINLGIYKSGNIELDRANLQMETFVAPSGLISYNKLDTSKLAAFGQLEKIFTTLSFPDDNLGFNVDKEENLGSVDPAKVDFFGNKLYSDNGDICYVKSFSKGLSQKSGIVPFASINSESEETTVSAKN